MIERSLGIARELGNWHGVMVALVNLGNVAFEQDDLPAATQSFEECLTQARRLGDRLVVAAALNNLGNVACKKGDCETARRMHSEGLDIRLELGARQVIADSLEGFANIAVGLNHITRAATLWGAAERLREDVGSPLPPSRQPTRDIELLAARKALADDAAYDSAWRAGRAMTFERAARYAQQNGLS